MANTAGIIRYIGLNDLEEPDARMVQAIAETHSIEIQRIMRNITNLTLNIKIYSRTGHRQKYSVHLKVESPTATITSDLSSEWDLQKATASAFRKLERQILHRFHTDTSLSHIRK
ncbi:hypothetical protein ACFL1H_03505 [Nanoarchaeota archaeon]